MTRMGQRPGVASAFVAMSERHRGRLSINDREGFAGVLRGPRAERLAAMADELSLIVEVISGSSVVREFS